MFFVLIMYQSYKDIHEIINMFGFRKEVIKMRRRDFDPWDDFRYWNNEMRRYMKRVMRDFEDFFPEFEENELPYYPKSGESRDLMDYYPKMGFDRFPRIPKYDLWESDKELVLEAELPGVDKKDIKVKIDEDQVQISAEVNAEIKKEDKKRGFAHFERNYAGFYRVIPLPKRVDPDKSKAKYENGVLRITMPKLEEDEDKDNYIDIE